jgi:hypothetical protein
LIFAILTSSLCSFPHRGGRWCLEQQAEAEAKVEIEVEVEVEVEVEGVNSSTLT